MMMKSSTAMQTAWRWIGEKGELPDGYNFLLYFDGEKVTIKKNGKDLNIYGDGQYRNDGGWFVPGYKNFPVDEKYGKARITIAAIDEPQLYTVALYGDGYGYYDGGKPAVPDCTGYAENKGMRWAAFVLHWLLLQFSCL